LTEADPVSTSDVVREMGHENQCEPSGMFPPSPATLNVSLQSLSDRKSDPRGSPQFHSFGSKLPVEAPQKQSFFLIHSTPSFLEPPKTLNICGKRWTFNQDPCKKKWLSNVYLQNPVFYALLNIY
jgi:hypothetical protein